VAVSIVSASVGASVNTVSTVSVSVEVSDNSCVHCFLKCPTNFCGSIDDNLLVS
jgi:hypothetical protein